jgi:hypothetical protein
MTALENLSRDDLFSVGSSSVQWRVVKKGDSMNVYVYKDGTKGRKLYVARYVTRVDMAGNHVRVYLTQGGAADPVGPPVVSGLLHVISSKTKPSSGTETLGGFAGIPGWEDITFGVPSSRRR